MTEDQHVILSVTNEIVCAALANQNSNPMGDPRMVSYLIDSVYNKIEQLVMPKTISSDRVEEV